MDIATPVEGSVFGVCFRENFRNISWKVVEKFEKIHGKICQSKSNPLTTKQEEQVDKTIFNFYTKDSPSSASQTVPSSLQSHHKKPQLIEKCHLNVSEIKPNIMWKEMYRVQILQK
uniref:Uncharacterized protein n=1 Tax=Megaselia scalaris TaxID=36166 RepID=T1GNU2_MEGSC